jgi:superoxide dismutase, Cu-Zn family
MRIRMFLVIAGLGPLLAGVPFAAAAQSAHADIVSAQGGKIGTATFTQTPNGVRVAVNVSQLTPPGAHGMHIHTVGKCEGPAFTSAGGHFNPTSAHHGIHSPLDPHPHMGDMPNLVVGSNRRASATFVLQGATLDEGPNSLFHEGGTSLVIHAKPDDLMSDPTGNSGDRIACGVIEK